MNKNLVLIIIGVVVLAALGTLGALMALGSLASDVGYPAVSSLLTLVIGALLALLDPRPVVVASSTDARTTPGA